METSNKLLFFGLILGISVIIAAGLVSNTFLAVKKMDNTISVTGSAKQAVTADSARWTGSFSRSTEEGNLKDGYAQMKRDETAVNSFFSSQGLDLKNLDISPVFMYQVYKNNDSAPKEYNLTQNIEIKSDDVEKITALAKNLDKLADKGIIFSANPVEYYYSKLPDLRVSLLPEAIKDAKKRAEAIASSSDRKVGSAESVSMGVVQVMPVGAVEISDYGSYDTSGIDKEVMITIKAVFNLK